MTKLVLDMGLPRRAAPELREQGWDVEHVAEIGFARATDEEILEYAAAKGAVVVTLDNDFARLVAVPNRSKPSLVHIRIARVTRDRLIELVNELLPDLEAELATGAVASVNERGARVRKLPLLG
jgi:predicted nuclease of predicted toxin-antitoxin system